MNTIGHLFSVTSFGESHGSHVGCVIDGCPAGLEIDLLKVQQQVDRRKTNQSSFSTSRNEDDQVACLSGVFEHKTTGSPITLMIKNKDAKSGDYDALKEVYRPNHADYTYARKYGIRDHRGGGRSSIRITAPLVAAGEIANQLLQQIAPITITAYVSQIGSVAMKNKHQYQLLDFSSIDQHEVRCPDEGTSKAMIALIEQAKMDGDTLGGVITCVVQGVPAGWGEPVFSKLQAELAKAMLSINTVKGFEYGYGFDASGMKGSEYNDAFEMKEGHVATQTNYSGGIQGGISNGMDIYFHVAFKPISSIRRTQKTIDTQGRAIDLSIDGRHDVCAVPRAVPIVEAYTALVLADAFLLNKNATI
ncbi:chorismate synthase [Filimonas sp.]|jgi:chorismate synthase|nr:chorismate synthase [Filimonas sp.]